MLINSVLGNPEQIISRINILSDEERKKILVEWNNTASFIDNIPIIKLFERQADIIPDNPAVIFGQSRMSYGELNRKADIVAGRLLQKGVGSETLIAICMDSSVELVEAVLGVLKVGGAFVPIDPQYPMERIATIVKDLGNPVIIY
jgi:non-ribosomal peptide synthetase component F